MKVVAIVQARTSSTRLPGKVMRPLAGVRVIQRVFNQLAQCRTLDGRMLATSRDASDDPLEEWAREQGVEIYRGDLLDVLDRFYHAALAAGLQDDDAAVRVTADCPVLNPSLVDEVVSKFRDLGLDYCSNVGVRTYPDGWDVEVMSVRALGEVWRRATSPYDREHVTPYFRAHPERFRQDVVCSPRDLSGWRITLDTHEDFETLERLALECGGGDWIPGDNLLRVLEKKGN